MIYNLVVNNLHEKTDFNLSFNEDINIFTGINGSGKTTVLKLIWLTISGNIERIFKEIFFSYMKLETDSFWIEIHQEFDKEDSDGIRISVNHNLDLKDKEKLILKKVNYRYIVRTDSIDRINRAIVQKIRQSVFFPTFRRIEGGFTINKSFNYFISDEGHTIRRRRDFYEEFQTIIERFSRDISVGKHLFVCSISTVDIVDLVTKKYADMSETLNKHYIDFSNQIIQSFSDYEKSKKKQNENAEEITLEKIKKEAEEIDKRRNTLLLPFEELNNFVDKIFHNSGIKITDKLNLGNKINLIDSNLLSAGEKQMLSFLVYNTFITDSPFFIDEPELSLHVDWQRILFRTLLNQGTNNQFFVTTHSPTIYSKYSDKEIKLEK